MIKKILKTEDGYNVVTNNGGSDHREYVFLANVMCHNENEVIGTDADGNEQSYQNTVFVYLDAFCEDSDFEKFLPDYKNLDEMKAHYVKGGLGDGTCKKFLLNVLNDRLEPIRQRRKEYEKDIPGVYEILRRGTEEARKVGAQTLAEVRHAMRIDYFDDKELIAEQAKRFAQQ